MSAIGMRQFLRLVVAVPLALAVFVDSPGLGVAVPLHRMSNGKILFEDYNAQSNLGVINPDGSGLRRVARCTTRSCLILDATWSPDGKRIAFVRGLTNTGFLSLSGLSVYVMNADGSGERRLAPCIRPPEYFGCSGNSLAWSPDGASLAIARSRSLYIFDLNTGRLRQLTAPLQCDVGCSPDNAAVDLDPAWSPDGSRIAFARALHGCIRPCPTEPYIVNADGTGSRRLSSLSSGFPFEPYLLWSPDGRTITFSALSGIYAIDPNGSHPTLLVPAPAARAKQVQMLASASPDGRHILYITGHAHAAGGSLATALWVMNANGTGRRRLFGGRYGFLESAIWSPDGQFIAFSGLVYPGAKKPHIPSKSGTFVMAADGGHLHHLFPAYSYVAGWQPIL